MRMMRTRWNLTILALIHAFSCRRHPEGRYAFQQSTNSSSGRRTLSYSTFIWKRSRVFPEFTIMEGMLPIFVECPDDGNGQKFLFHKESTFEDLKTAAATHFKKDLPTLQLYVGNDVLCLPDNISINAILKEGDTLRIRGQMEAISVSTSESLSQFNGEYSEEEALHFALTQHDNQMSLTPMAPSAATTSDEDLLGQTIYTGTISQYSSGGGSSACTSICLVAAHRLLNSDMASLKGSDLDDIVWEGIHRHSQHDMEHSSISDLWGLSQFSHVRCSLKLHEAHQGHLSSSSVSNGFLAVLRRALENASMPKVAILLTKTPETVLCLSMPSGVYLFDSHGQSHAPEKRVYLQKFDAIEELANALLIKYPPQDFDGEQSMLRDMYNTFEVHPLTSTELADVEKGSGGTTSGELCDDGFDEASIQQAILLSLNSKSDTKPALLGMTKTEVEIRGEPKFMGGPALTTEPSLCPEYDIYPNEDSKPPAIDLAQKAVIDLAQKAVMTVANSPTITAANRSSTSGKTFQYFERDDYEDPISKEIMADPVKCADGYTYERRNIERHFRTRIEAEEKRRQEETGGQQQEAGDTCCGARRRIELTSPLTQEVLMTDTLVPDKNLERIIVRLVESNAFDMTEGDIQEWNELREEKRVHDREREQELEAIRVNELRMEEQAILAEERRRAEGSTSEGIMPLAEQVRVDRNIRVESQKLDEKDLGLSVSLCEQGDEIVPGYITTTSQQMRCMVACCASLVDSEPSWCARCGRIVCKACLDFGVTDISVTNPTSLHAVCSECVTQILDAIDPSDFRSCQTRDIIRRINLEQHSARLVNAAADAQDQIVRYETNEAYRIRLEERRQEIQSLQSRRTTLEQQILRAMDNARQARQDETVDDSLDADASADALPEDIETLQKRHHELEQELAEINEAETPGDEAGQMRYVIQREERILALQRIQAQLVEAVSALSAATPHRVQEESSETSLEELHCQYCSLVASRPPHNDEDAQLQYYVRLSELESRLERAQISHAEAESSQQQSVPVSHAVSHSCALLLLLNAIERHGRRRLLRKHPGRARKSDVQRIRQLISEISQKEKKGTSHSASYRQTVGELRDRIDQLPPKCSEILAAEIRAARIALGSKEEESFAMAADPVQELLRLQRVDISALDEEEQIKHVMRMSHLQETMKRLEEALLGESTVRHVDDNSATDRAHEDRSVSATAADQQVSDNSTIPRARDECSASAVPAQQVSEAVVDYEPGSLTTNTESVFSISTLLRGIGSLVSSLSSPVTTTPEERTTDLNECRARLEAIGKRETEWRLPLGLEYPTPSMEQQLEILRNTLELRLVDSQRHWERECAVMEEQLVAEINELEDTIQNLISEANSAESTAAQERARLQERRRQRVLERQRQEARRREEERRRQEQMRRAQEEARALHERQEAQTNRAFAAARGGRNQASAFGGSGDLRMCRRCKAGPFENKACADLRSHNDHRANHCPNCGWHDPNWHNWPYFDGIHGPH